MENPIEKRNVRKITTNLSGLTGSVNLSSQFERRQADGRWLRGRDTFSASVLPPRQAVQAPAAALAPVRLGVRIAFEAFQDVVGLQPKFGGALGRCD